MMNTKGGRANQARHTLQVLESGHYTNEAEEEIYIAEALNLAIKNTTLYEPALLESLVAKYKDGTADIEKRQTRIRIKAQTTLACAYDICVNEGAENVMVLNFASAKNPGGGFLNGAQAQEESLARASGLYYCQTAQPKMYEANRQIGNCLYTDYMIYSPAVPVFKDDKGSVLDDYYTVNMITAPAVNKGAIIQNEPHKLPEVLPVMLSRIEKLLSVAHSHGNTTLILGAWGCGVFRNDPEEVASLFAKHLLDNSIFSSAFEHIIFAIPSHGDDKTLKAFEKHFA